jgi:hypothetical protein
MKNLMQTQPQCPYCLSNDVTPISAGALAAAGAGGLIGGIVAAVLSESNSDNMSAGSLVTGVLTGAMAGLSLGKEIQSNASGTKYLCLGCFRSFTHTPYPYQRENGGNRRRKPKIA